MSHISQAKQVILLFLFQASGDLRAGLSATRLEQRGVQEASHSASVSSIHPGPRDHRSQGRGGVDGPAPGLWAGGARGQGWGGLLLQQPGHHGPPQER